MLAPPGAGGPIEQLKPYARGFMTIAIAGVGMMLCATVGSLAYPIGGVGVIFGAILGLVLFGLIGCCATGAWADILPSSADVFNLSSMLPGPLAEQVGGKGRVTLILTIHKTKYVEVHGQVPWAYPDLFVEVSCGTNPVRNTCVKKDGKWTEQMKLEIGPLDQSILLRIKNQDIFGSSDIGYVCVDVLQDILEPAEGAPFPANKEFEVEAGQGDWLRFPTNGDKPVLVLSFTNLDSEWLSQKQKLMDSTVGKGKAGGTNYGSADNAQAQFITSIQFNPNMAAPVTTV
jgi:hypothetical protein